MNFLNESLLHVSEKQERVRTLIENPTTIQREITRRSLLEFIIQFWSEVSNDTLQINWHMEYLCQELETIAQKVARGEKRSYDLLINIPPGTTKTTICSVMFPVWCWTNWHWMKFITASYSAALALESAELSRDVIRSKMFKELFPELELKEDKDTKSNFKIIKKHWYSGTNSLPRIVHGGNRYSTSVGGTLTGFHGHILIIDDPLNPYQATSETERNNANRWVDLTLSTRKTDKDVSTQIMVMQRLHNDDPSGHWLSKKKKLRHVCLPGELKGFQDLLQPKELEKYYIDGLLDISRLSWDTLEGMESDLGQFGYKAQVGQAPVTHVGEKMFKVEFFHVVDVVAMDSTIPIVRYWDKAASKGTGAYTVGVKMMFHGGKFVVLDVKRGQWSSEEREKIIRTTAEADGTQCKIYVEQEPGSGGKESAESTITNLAGFVTYADRPTGDKVYRADPFSVQVNNGNVLLIRADWNKAFIDEFESFPHGKYKDQVDAASGAFAKLARRKVAKMI